MEILRRGKSIFDQAIVKIDQSISEYKLDKLELGNFYGFSGEVKVVDQLASPDPDKIAGYFGKIMDKKAAERFGADNLEDYSFWSWRSCGVADVLTIFKSYNLYAGKLFHLVKEIESKGGYLYEDKWGRKDIGWKYSSLCDSLASKGLNASIVSRLSIARLLNELVESRFIIASVKSRNNSGSHMITLSGFVWNKENSILFVHDPYNLDNQGGDKQLLLKDFRKIFSNRGIVIWKE